MKVNIEHADPNLSQELIPTKSTWQQIKSLVKREFFVGENDIPLADLVKTIG